MKRTSVKTLLLWGLFGLAGGMVVNYLWEASANALPGLPWLAVIGMLLLSVVLCVLAWPIKQWRDGDRSTEIDSIQAARVAMMAKAANLAGALLTGWYGGTSLFYFVSAGGIRADTGLAMLIPVAAAAVLTIVGVVVESFCSLPPGSGGSPSGEEPSPTA